MTPFHSAEGPVHRLPLANVDTDQLMPARFMKEPRLPEGYGRFLLADVTAADPALKRPDGAPIVVARRNFGCGSSREAAVYALADAGVRCVIAPSFGDIFAANAVKNGMLPALVSEADAEALLGGDGPLRVDLERGVVTAGDVSLPFSIDPVWRTQLLNGWDDIDLTRAEAESIAAYRARRALEVPWAVGV